MSEKVRINREDGEKLGLQSGEKVELSNSRGIVVATVELSDDVAIGVVAVCHGGMFFPIANKDVGGCSNTLVKRRSDFFIITRKCSLLRDSQSPESSL